ncbi:MAG: TniB family NTP-binding protein [Janthinobacterium lividum]
MSQQSATMARRPATDMSVVERRVRAEVEFKALRIPLPHVRSIQAELEVLRRVGRESKGQSQKIQAIIGPSHSGKTTVIKDWCEIIGRQAYDSHRRHPILYVNLTEHATVKSMAGDIALALGADALPLETVQDVQRSKPRRHISGAGTIRDSTGIMMHLAARAMQNAGVELLIIDELHHLIRGEGATRTRWDVTEALKWLADQGVCPVVCIGIRKIQSVVDATTNSQMANRQTMPVYIEPVDMRRKDQAQTFVRYCTALDVLMVKQGILAERSGLASKQTVECLYDVSKGILGRVSRLVEVATQLAIGREHHSLHDDDLSDATDRYAIRLNLTKHNPWVDGPRDFEVIWNEAKRQD